jgi:hypothetical protein
LAKERGLSGADLPTWSMSSLLAAKQGSGGDVGFEDAKIKS